MDQMVADFKPTEEQDRIVEDAFILGDNMQINAYAGCGKTSTIEMIDRVLPSTPRLYLAFNKRIVDEIKKKGRVQPSTFPQTLNSLGHRAWAQVITSRVVIEDKKTLNLFKHVLQGQSKESTKELWGMYDEVKTAVGLAKAQGYIPEGVAGWEKRLVGRENFFSGLEDRLELIATNIVDRILIMSIKQAYAGVLDFNDQLYMSALFGGTFPRYPTVMIDECQDLSPINHKMIEKLCRNSRIFSVGDEFQSIYQFRGAMQDGMLRQRQKHSMLVRPLSVSFRCPRAIVENARWRAPEFSWLKDGGRVECLHRADLREIPENSAIICRNNAPLFRMAINLLSCQRSVSMAGTDIGARLLTILRKFGDESLSRSAVHGCIDEWLAKRLESRSASDTAECLRIFANLGKDLGQIIAYAEYVLKQDGKIHLTTGHKAKGLEWEVVYHLDPWLLDTNEQDLNLRYVIQTRSAGEYYEINSDQIEAA